MTEVGRQHEERATKLHYDSLVVDTLGQDGPWINTAEVERRLEELLASGASASATLLALQAEIDSAVLGGKLPEFWEEWERAGVDLVSCTIGGFGEKPFSFENAVRDAAIWTRRFDSLDRLRKVTQAADARRAKEEGRFGVILNFQNTQHIGDDLANLDLFYDFGVRIIQLTYNQRNLVGDGCTERNPGGLSRFGLQLVKHMNASGIMVDLSHCSESTSFDAIEASTQPVAITHAFAKSLSDHDRGKSDDLIRAIGEANGYFGVLLVPFFLTADPDPSLDHFMDHFNHIVELIGPDHVGVGSDWGPRFPKPLVDLLNEEMRRFGFREEHRVDFGATLDGYEQWQDWPNITKAFVAHGYSDEEIRGFLGENFLRTFEEVVG